ncbi:MAG: TIGR02147 family protein [Bdellovibrionia bacterium]
MKSIYRYTDYRDLLVGFYEHRKTLANFSYAKFAKQAGLKSPNHLILIVKGKRNLTSAAIHGLADAMKLNFRERGFFEALVRKNQAVRPSEIQFYSSRVRELSRKATTERVVIRDDKLFSDWYFPALLFFLDGRQAEIDSKQLARQIGVSEVDVENGIRELTSSGLLEVINQRFSLKHRYLLFDDPRYLSEAKRAYTKAQLTISQKVFERSYGRGPEFHARTFTISREDFVEIHSKLRAAIEKIVSDNESRPGTAVAQLNIQFFKLEEAGHVGHSKNGKESDA